MAKNAAVAPEPEPKHEHDRMSNEVEFQSKHLPRRFSLQQAATILRARRFFARARPKTENITLHVFSLHGYSSLRMIQDGMKACKEKVSLSQ